MFSWLFSLNEEVRDIVLSSVVVAILIAGFISKFISVIN